MNLGFHYSADHYNKDVDRVLMEEVFGRPEVRSAQIFFCSPHNYLTKLEPERIERYAKTCQFLGKMGCVVYAHAGYMSSFARADRIGRITVLDATNYMKMAGLLEVPMVTFHVGAWKSDLFSYAQNLANMYENISEIISNSPASVTMLLETSKGHRERKDNGSIYTLMDFFDVYGDRLGDRVQATLDTQHVYADGFMHYGRWLGAPEVPLDARLGDFIRNRVKLIHLNPDEGTKQGDHKDRHSFCTFEAAKNLTAEGMASLIQLAEEKDLPMIIERRVMQAIHKDVFYLIQNRNKLLGD